MKLIFSEWVWNYQKENKKWSTVSIKPDRGCIMHLDATKKNLFLIRICVMHSGAS